MENSLANTLMSAAFLLLGLVVMTVNLLTITVVLRSPQLRHSDQWQVNLHVLSLAVADLLVGTALVWMACLFLPVTRQVFDSSYVLCMSGVIVASISAAASNGTLGTMALDRFCYIVYPFWYKRFVSERTTKIYILVIWCASVVSACWASLTRNNFATIECKPVTVVMVYDTKIILTTLLLFQSTMASVCYLRIACVVRTQQRRVRATVPTPANHSFRDNHVIQAESSISDKDEVVKPEASACKSSPKSLVSDAQIDLFSSKNVVLELQLADFQEQGNNGDDLQAGETFSNSSHVALNSDSVLLPNDQVVAQTEKVAISLATDKTGELRGSSLDSNAGSPQTKPTHPVNTGPSLVHHCIADRTVSRRIPEKDSNVQKPQSVGMFVAINVLFSLSWFPFIVYAIFFDRGTENNDRSMGLIIMPVYANSLLNFAVYTWKNIEYRKAYKRLFINFVHCVCMRRA